LLDDLTAKVSVDQAPVGAMNSLDEAHIANAMLAGELRKCLGFEKT
jgi:hypothetical protein